MRPFPRPSYGAIDPSVISTIIGAVGGLAATSVETVGQIETAKVQQATEEKRAQAAAAAAEAERLAAQRSASTGRFSGRATPSTSDTTKYLLGGLGVLVLVAGGVYLYRRRK